MLPVLDEMNDEKMPYEYFNYYSSFSGSEKPREFKVVGVTNRCMCDTSN